MTQYVESFLPVSEIFVLIKLHGQPFEINLVHVYAPTGDSSGGDLENVYSDIES